ncbi:MAG: hypothetical protein DIZ80_05280 [endosymbiont of Galathealinum brachiosum]|uniref:histidine kinase n=1 Tax=endosymbiont of Galathealinum brachiosum TaxID=2200906 RepID=A0A370DIX8_9GAMM|nr:MAG: hypothetical protein DIZ80_05280 [endosymbiont of Galathealinum brachiosum]
MLLSIKQYAIIFTLFIVFLITVFTYQISRNIEEAGIKIDKSQEASSTTELEHSIQLTVENIKQSANELSQWEEVTQQINSPEIFAYWYNVRFKKSAFDLQKYTVDLMIYDVDGKALEKLDDNTLPFEIKIEGIDAIKFRFVNDQDVIYILPVYSTDESRSVIGYVSTQIKFIPLLKSLSNFQFVKSDSIQFIIQDQFGFYDSLNTEQFLYVTRKPEGLLRLENQIQESIIQLVFIIIIPTLILFSALVFIVAVPMKDITNYINTLRAKPANNSEYRYQRLFQVTELKTIYESLAQYHRELNQNEEHLSLTLNSIGDAVITTDSENNVVRMNPVAEKLTGWSISNAKGTPLKEVFNVIDPANKESMIDTFDRVINSGEVVHLGKRSTLISKNNTEYIIADSAAPIRDDSGKIHGIVLVFNDITEQRMKDEQLQHSLKMDALGKLTGGIAHDFNNLLGVILGYSELLTTSKNLNEHKMLNYAEKIFNAGERARKLTSQLLAFSRKQTSESTITDINQLLQSEQHMLEKILTARVELILDLDKKIWPVYLDQNLLQDAILNMSINSMHAMPDGGQLILSTQNIHLDGLNKKHVSLPEGDYVHFTINDTGIGMDNATCNKIFDPFFSTKGDQGTGLGMSQVYGFVKQSNGAIYAYSTRGAGTQISIYLPRYSVLDDTSNEIDKVKLKIDVVPAGNESILVVDDEPALLELSCNILKSQGYQVTFANSGDEALSILEKNTIHLLLTDVIMPKMDGFQLASIVAEKYPETKIQMVSGYSDDKNKHVEDDDLHQNMLHKPFKSDELLIKVRKTLDS